MADNQFITNQAAYDELKRRTGKLLLGHAKPLIAELWQCFETWQKNAYFRESRWNRVYVTPEIYNEYKKLCGKDAESCRTLEEFFCPALLSGLKTYFGREETDRITEECRLLMEFPYSHSTYRPSYRSARACDYTDQFFTVMLNSIYYQCCGWGRLHTKSVNRIALALRRGNTATFAALEEAILGDNSEVKFSHAVISVIVKSGDPKALELLGNMLLAAKGQEGLRQAILETCDSGTIDSHKYFIKLILDNGLCRFSSCIRAFDTWCGLSFGDQKQKIVEKMMALALKLLGDEDAARDSSDTTEIYMGLWALSVRDINSATDAAVELLGSPEKYRRLTGWYFITHTNNEIFRHNLAVRFLDARDLEELAWIAQNVKTNSEIHRDYWGGYYSNYEEENEQEAADKKYPVDYYPSDSNSRAALFDQAAAATQFIGKKSAKFSPSVFPWCEVQLSPSNVFGLMIGLAGYDRSKELILKTAAYLAMADSDNRHIFYGKLLDPKTPSHRALLLAGLGDKSPAVKEMILQRLMFYPLDADDAAVLEKSLTTTKAGLRKATITLLEKQSIGLITPVIDHLLDSGSNSQILAGTELLELFGKKQPEIIASYKEKVSALRTGGMGEDFEILARRIYPDKSSATELTLENGFGLFKPDGELLRAGYWAKKRPVVEVLSDAKLKTRIVPDEADTVRLYERLLDVWARNKEYEYEAQTHFGGKETALLGSQIVRLASYDRENPKGIYDYPLAEQWLEAAGDFASAPEKLTAIMSLWTSHNDYLGWFSTLFRGYPLLGNDHSLAAKITAVFRERAWWVNRFDEIIRAIIRTAGTNLFDFAFTAYVNLVNKIPVDRLGDSCYESKEQRYNPPGAKPLETGYLQHWRWLAHSQITSDEQFSAYFSEMWYEYLASGKEQYYGLGDADVFRARSLELLNDEAVYYYLLLYPRNNRNDHPFRCLTNKRWAKDIFEKYPAATTLLDKALDAVVSVESKRGELVTPLTHTTAHIDRFTGGITHFVTLLAALGNGGFSRSAVSSYLGSYDSTKKDTLSHLLRRCQPFDTDTAEELRGALKQAKIPEKRTVQAALFAPQWAGLLEQTLDIPGLKCGVWFFHAHINEDFSVEKETEVGIFSAITSQQFRDGAFDKDWFFEAYNALGEKRFIELYKNAKLITNSNVAHRRSQLYTEAVLGRMDKTETLAEIKEKRNQERLRAYALIPLDVRDKADALRRYEFINQFKKESRQFGSQRQASEGKAVEVAMDNLAITTGYGDADRMTWALEGQKIEQLRPLMEPHTIGETTVRLVIRQDGTPNVEAVKKGKLLTSLPKELNKDEYVAGLKAAAKSLKDQKSRARLKFEMAMVSRTAFRSVEIAGLLRNPVLSDTVATLVFASGDTLGFPVLSGENLALKSFNDNAIMVSADVIIAHPYDFMRQKCWSDYQRYLFTQQIKQPFKQIFREYYPLTDDEKQAATVSTRYEGYQVQPKKTIALLKTRGWTADYEEGLQRVWHKEKLVVRIYAMADWFSPSDIEAPTLETIQFYRRDRWERVSFDEVPPVIFSETMRDIDLVVSVAYVGGVDPETSHSTVEMRTAIARELLTLLGVKNVSFKTSHAIVQGASGEYSVHLGNGIIHKLGAGMIAVLPVHSQRRGRIFLPFADDDPKTAEIMSKILLFAEDSKIKDPGILRQIQG